MNASEDSPNLSISSEQSPMRTCLTDLKPQGPQLLCSEIQGYRGHNYHRGCSQAVTSVAGILGQACSRETRDSSDSQCLLKGSLTALPSFLTLHGIQEDSAQPSFPLSFTRVRLTEQSDSSPSLS